MALSNWDTCAYGPDGKPSDGILSVDDKNSVEIYKNFVYLRLGVNPVIGINNGSVTVSGISIEAARYPKQNSVFLYVTIHKEDETHRMAGIGCYGFRNNVEEALEKLGRKEEPGEFWVESSSSSPNEVTRGYIEEMKTRETITLWEGEENRPRLEDQWIGLLPETHLAFLEWLRKTMDFDDYLEIPHFQEDKAWYDAVVAATPKHFNQGDEFLSGGNAPMSDIGETTPPIIQGMMDELFQ